MASVLYDDVMLAVLESCDVRSILVMGRVSIRFRALSLSKHVWHALVWDLVSRSLIDLHPGTRKVEDLTVYELIDEVKRFVVGPKTWVPRRARPSGGVTVKPRLLWRKDLPEIHRPADLLGVTLLPGGKFLFMACDSFLELRDTDTGTLLWTWQQSNPRYKTFAFEMLSDDVLMLLLYPHRSGSSNDMQLVRVDLKSGDSAVVFCVELVPSKDIEPCIHGQFICAGVKVPGSRDVHFLLFNWVDSQYMLFRLQRGQRVLVALTIPGHLLLSVAEPETPRRQLLLFFSLDSLRFYWRPIHLIHYDEFLDVFNYIYVVERHPVLLTHIDEKEAWPGRRWQLRVLEDALYRGSYRVLMYASDVVADGPRRTTNTRRATLYSFRIALDRSSFVGWEHISTVAAVPGVLKFSELSTYSGHCFARLGHSIHLVSLRLEAGEAAKQGIVDGLVTGLSGLSDLSLGLNGGLVTFEEPATGAHQAALSYYL